MPKVNKKYVKVGVAGLAATALVIGLSVGLTQRNKKRNTSAATAKGADFGASSFKIDEVCPPPAAKAAKTGKSGDMSMAKSGKSGDMSMAKSGKSGDMSMAKSGKSGDMSMAKSGKSGDMSMAKSGKSGDMSMAKSGKSGDMSMAKSGKSGDKSGKSGDMSMLAKSGKCAPLMSICDVPMSKGTKTGKSGDMSMMAKGGKSGAKTGKSGDMSMLTDVCSGFCFELSEDCTDSSFLPDCGEDIAVGERCRGRNGPMDRADMFCGTNNETPNCPSNNGVIRQSVWDRIECPPSPCTCSKGAKTGKSGTTKAGKSGDMSMAKSGKSGDMSMAKSGKSGDMSMAKSGKSGDMSMAKSGKSGDMSMAKSVKSGNKSGKSGDMSMMAGGCTCDAPTVCPVPVPTPPLDPPECVCEDLGFAVIDGFCSRSCSLGDGPFDSLVGCCESIGFDDGSLSDCLIDDECETPFPTPAPTECVCGELDFFVIDGVCSRGCSLGEDGGFDDVEECCASIGFDDDEMLPDCPVNDDCGTPFPTRSPVTPPKENTPQPTPAPTECVCGELDFVVIDGVCSRGCSLEEDGEFDSVVECCKFIGFEDGSLPNCPVDDECGTPFPTPAPAVPLDPILPIPPTPTPPAPTPPTPTPPPTLPFVLTAVPTAGSTPTVSTEATGPPTAPDRSP